MADEMQADGSDIKVGRVLKEDGYSIILEIPKDMKSQIHLEEGDTFLTLLFVHNTAPEGQPATMAAWTPWEGR